MAKPQVIFQTERLRAQCYGAQNDRLVVTFDHYAIDKTGFPEKPRARAFAKAGWGQLMIHTATNDWFLNEDLPAMRAALKAFMQGRARTNRALGFSMGAFGTLLLRDVLALEAAVVISPQVSPLPDDPPFDTRYAAWADRIDRNQLSLPSSPDYGRAFVLYDPRFTADRAHVDTLKTLVPEVVPCAMPFAGHPANTLISQSGRFGLLQGLVTSDALDAAAVRTIHRKARRHAPIYWRKMQAWAGASRPALAKEALTQRHKARKRLERR